MGSRLDARTLKDEVASMDRRPLLDLGHPLLNRVADSFIRAAGATACDTLGCRLTSLLQP